MNRWARRLHFWIYKGFFRLFKIILLSLKTSKFFFRTNRLNKVELSRYCVDELFFFFFFKSRFFIWSFFIKIFYWHFESWKWDSRKIFFNVWYFALVIWVKIVIGKKLLFKSLEVHEKIFIRLFCIHITFFSGLRSDITVLIE